MLDPGSTLQADITFALLKISLVLPDSHLIKQPLIQNLSLLFWENSHVCDILYRNTIILQQDNVEAYRDITTVLLEICLVKQKLQQAWRGLCGRQSTGKSLLLHLSLDWFSSSFKLLWHFWIKTRQNLQLLPHAMDLL